MDIRLGGLDRLAADFDLVDDEMERQFTVAVHFYDGEGSTDGAADQDHACDQRRRGGGLYAG